MKSGTRMYEGIICIRDSNDKLPLTLIVFRQRRRLRVLPSDVRRSVHLSHRTQSAVLLDINHRAILIVTATMQHCS